MKRRNKRPDDSGQKNKLRLVKKTKTPKPPKVVVVKSWETTVEDYVKKHKDA